MALIPRAVYHNGFCDKHSEILGLRYCPGSTLPVKLLWYYVAMTGSSLTAFDSIADIQGVPKNGTPVLNLQ